MTWVKVCGLTRSEDVTHAVGVGADAVGFVAYPGSLRYVPLPTIAALAADVPVLTVLLTVDDADIAMAAAETTGVRAIQPYGPDAAEIVRRALAAHLEVLHPMHHPADPHTVAPEAIPLIDTPDRDLYGGTGRTFEWQDLVEIERDFVLAGGLGPHNVADAIRIVRPWGVDASSGLEAAPGIKDPGKVSLFVEEAKRT